MSVSEQFRAAMEAMQRADTGELERLFSRGLDPNHIEGPQGLALLTYLPRQLVNDVSPSQMTDLIQVILAAGGDPNIVNGAGNRPIDYSRSMQMVELLVDHGAIVDSLTASTLAFLFSGRRVALEYLGKKGFEYEWADSLRHVAVRCRYAADDGLTLVDVLTEAAPFVASQVDQAQTALAREHDLDGALVSLYALNRANDFLIEGMMPAARQVLEFVFGESTTTRTEYEQLMCSRGPVFEFVPERTILRRRSPRPQGSIGHTTGRTASTRTSRTVGVQTRSGVPG